MQMSKSVIAVMKDSHFGNYSVPSFPSPCSDQHQTMREPFLNEKDSPLRMGVSQYIAVVQEIVPRRASLLGKTCVSTK